MTMTQEELDELVAQVLHVDVGALRLSALLPVECHCGGENCRGWRVVDRSQVVPGTEADQVVTQDEVIMAECPVCEGDAYRVVTRGRAADLPVDFVICTVCAFLGVMTDGVVLPITDELDDMLKSNYGVEYQRVRDLRATAKCILLAANAQWN